MDIKHASLIMELYNAAITIEFLGTSKSAKVELLWSDAKEIRYRYVLVSGTTWLTDWINY